MRRWLVAALSTCVLGGCLGGQTGQPASLDCVETSDSRLGKVYLGEHHLTLHWLDGMASDEALMISVADSGKVASYDQCSQEDRAVVRLHVSTVSGSVSEEGNGVFSAAHGTLTPAQFTLVGSRFTIQGTWTGAPDAARVHGELTTAAGSTISTVATFE